MVIIVLTGLKDWLSSLGMMEKHAILVASVIAFISVLLISWVVYQILNRVIIYYLKKLTHLTLTTWDNILFEKKVFRRLSHLVPAIIIHYGVTFAMEDFPVAVEVIQQATYLYMVIAVILVIDAVINSFHEIYNTLPVSKNRSIKGLVQVVKIFIYILGFGIVISIILQKDLTTFFAGLGAMAAVIMLIFKDSILGFVAGVQLSANDMVHLGDWIEMPSRNADGNIIDISLNTVKVQNWDQTISTIPPYALITESFTNWRGMEESGGRRLTNIGTFRKYVEEYLMRHPKIHNDMTFLVRHLQPTDKGLPIEIYVFSNDQRWAFYEAIQADIFDHILAVIPQFGLSIYQNPTGDDIARFIGYNQQTGT